MHSINEINGLIKLLSKMPALGPRSARRMVLHLLNHKEDIFIPLLQQMNTVLDTVSTCPVCGNLDTSSPCHLCANPARNPKQICIVQDVADLWALERAGVFTGVYHVLGGVLSALDGIGPEQLCIDSLIKRIEQNEAQEIIFALPSTLEGQTTTHYLANRLKVFPDIHLSALSKGVPLGGELDYLDDGTLQMAFTTRQNV